MQPPPAPPDAAVARFARDLQRLIGPLGDRRLGLAVSGGPDSVALLLLAHAAFPAQIDAATVDHGLRPESKAEAAFVAGLCTALQVPHAMLAIAMPDGGNLPATARDLRYEALQGWAQERKLSWFATAHHADDQLETLVMRLNRASGLPGLSGIRTLNPPVVRPLLRWRRAELVEIIAASGIEAVDDPTNRDTRFDRARLRAQLANADIFDPRAVARSVEALQHADAALDWAVTEFARHLVMPLDDGVLLDRALFDIPAELERRLLLHALRRVEPGLTPRGDALAAFRNRLREGSPAMLGIVLARPAPDGITLTTAPPRRG